MLDWARIERTITEFIPRNTLPRAMYNLGIGNHPKNEAATLKAVYPKMSVYGCEPHRTTFDERRADYPGILISAAIRNYAGMTELFLPELSDMASVYARCTRSVSVPCITLDMFDAMCGQPRDVLLWMDIEGAELEAIEGGGNLLRSGRVKWINTELREQCLSDGESNAEQIEHALAGLGFVLQKKYSNQTTHQDGIFVLR